MKAPSAWAHPLRTRGWRNDFHELMGVRVVEILLVASPYDSFILEEDGHLTERVLGEFLDLGLYHPPGITQVSTGSEALRLAKLERRFDLIITSLQVGDMNAFDLARHARTLGVACPVVVLVYDNRDLTRFASFGPVGEIDRIFLWQGDVRILLAIVKYIEDKSNVAYDSGTCGVPVVLVVEDSVRYYSSFLPAIYTELLKHTHGLISEGVNLSHKMLRMRARPKVLLVSTFEEAWSAFTTYQDEVLGVISDIEFPRNGQKEATAGVELVRRVREQAPDVPIGLQSSRPENAAFARELDATFLLKGSPTLLADLSAYMVEYFGFGDFIFRKRDGVEVGRARDMRSLEDLLHTVPGESIVYHGERNHFSKWLKARTEFALAHRLQPRRMSDYPNEEAIRLDLIASIAQYRRELSLGVVADFDRDTFDGTGGFHRLGGGSLGGKARGLAFVRRLLADSDVSRRFPGVEICVPVSAVVATDVFDQFLEQNNLRDFVLNCDSDENLLRRLLDSPLPAGIRNDLEAFLARVLVPLAVRSSSLLEDSQYLPFTGVYQTYMLPNSHPDANVRLEQLLRAIKGVYASTFTQQAKAYLKDTPYRLEEEKMAVLLQAIVGKAYGDRFYPDFSGVARSHSFYPTAPSTPEDGIVAVALGLGRTVVDGENCVRFSPKFPRHLMPYSSVSDVLENSQRRFWALELSNGHAMMDPEREMREVAYGLEIAEQDGVLTAMGSTYSPDNNAIYDGMARPGVRLVSFAPILKHQLFPLAEILSRVMDIGIQGMAGPVEIEFAVNLQSAPGKPHEFGLLQLRPLSMGGDGEDLALDEYEPSGLLCYSANVLGNGRLCEIRDLVVVDFFRFDRSRSRETALEVAQFNAVLVAEGTPYLLAGVGRWGSNDPWLGIPVTWDQISGARVIIESGFRDFKVVPSQGAHFFQHLITFQVGFFTVNPELGDGFIDWEWLASQPAVAEGTFVRHIRLDQPAEVAMNGRKHQGIIAKPH